MITHNGHKIISSKGLKKDHSASDALKRRQQLRDELERRQVPGDQVEELRALSERFLSHMAGQFAFWERLEHYARRQKSCW